MFIQHSSWSEAWAKNKLEAALFGTDQGTQKFWQEACAAQEQTATDALEVFFLCVQFGFRGAWRDSQDQVDRWVAAAKNRLSSAPTKARPSSVELEPVTDVPPLHGLRQMKRMVLVCGVCFLVLIPLVVFLLVRATIKDGANNGLNDLSWKRLGQSGRLRFPLLEPTRDPRIGPPLPMVVAFRRLGGACHRLMDSQWPARCRANSGFALAAIATSLAAAVFFVELCNILGRCLVLEQPA